jgi:hypothetical protein
MSWFTDLRDNFIKFQTVGLYDPKSRRHAESDQRHLIEEQMRAYKEQTELTRKSLEEARTQRDVEKRRVQEKQIRSLRRNYRASSGGGGMLGVGQPASEDMNNKLGG